MDRTFGWALIKLCGIAAMSTACLLLMVFPIRAHEVTPTIADLTIVERTLELNLRLNVEAFVAGIDLDGLADTDGSEKSPDYDALRSMDETELLPMVRSFTRHWLEKLRIDASGPVSLTVGSITIPEIGDPTLPRASHLILTGEIPPGANHLILSWPKGAGDLVLRQQGVENPFTGYVLGGDSSPPLKLKGGDAQSAWQAFISYVPVGFVHILPKGLDHILFVLGLFFLGSSLSSLIWQISAFTLAHTVTLALGALGWVQVPPQIVEPLIAASIVYVAIENVLASGPTPWRLVVVFGFGLLHGLGFASVLGEFGLPADQFVPALVGFNVGVELGQLTVIAIAFLTVGLWFRGKPWYRGLICVPASVVIALVGFFWLIQRIV